jgi:hypothetical protein
VERLRQRAGLFEQRAGTPVARADLLLADAVD